VRFIEELKRRNVFRVGVAYVISAWVLLQFADLVLGNIDAPGWVIKVFMLALAIGFPLALFFAWAFEMTPEGIKREKDVDRTHSITAQTGRKLDRSIIVILLIAVVYLAWQNFSQDKGSGSIPPRGTPGTESSVQGELNQIPAASKSIAVLPFADLSQAQDQEWFADGLAEEILNALAKTPDLLVSSRTSSFRYKNSNLDIPEIAKELGVAHVLEGSVRSAGNRIRVTAQLIRASDGFHLWSENYDRDVADMIEIQEDLARNIAKALETTMDPDALAAMTSVGTRSVEAYQEFLRGQAAFLASYSSNSSQGDQLFTEAYDHFEKARAIDPGFAAAHSMASAFWRVQLDPKYTSSGLTQTPPRQMLAEFSERIDKAIAAAASPLDKKAYMTTKALVDLRLRDAIRYGREYLEERPNDEEARLSLVEAASFASDKAAYRNALAYYQERGSSDLFSAVAYVADAYRASDPSEAADFGLTALQRWPDSSGLLYQTHRTLMWAGRYAEGKTLADRYSRLYPDDLLMVQARQACAEGRRADVEAMLESIDPDDNYARSSRWHLLKLLGREQEAIAALQPYADSGVPFMIASWLTYPNFDPTPFPSVMAMLDREGVKRPPTLDLPFKCPPPEQPSIAVLPFVNMSTDAENEFFSDGISEEILNVLASIPNLKVAARTSAFAFKNSTTGIAEIAKTLGVNHVLEGSVRKSGNKVRVTAQLIKADDGFHLWSANYDRELTDIFAIQDEIANSIADALKVTLDLKSVAAGNLTGTMSIAAYERYLKGMSLWHLRTADSLTKSIEEFNQAKDLDPQFAKAYAGLSLAWAVIDGYVMMDSVTANKNAEAAAQKSLSLDPNNVEALAALAQVRSSQSRYAEAEELFQNVIALNPSFATAHQWYGNMLGFMGNPQAGLVELQKAWDLDPRSRIIGSNLALTLSWLGRHQEAVDRLNEVLEFAPEFPDAVELLMHIEIGAGNCVNVSAYGNQLASLLNKTSNTTQAYVDLCQSSDLDARKHAVETILAWPTLDFPEADNPSLSYIIELAPVMIELHEFEAAIQLIEKNMSFGGDYVFRQLPARKSKNAVAFYCDPRVQAMYRKYDIPTLESGRACD